MAAVKLGSFTQPTSPTASFATTGVGFQPVALMLFMAQTAAGTSSKLYRMLGMATSPVSRAVTFTEVPGTGTNTYRSHQTSSCYVVYAETASPAVLAQADLVSFDSDGFTLNFTAADAVARVIWYLAFGGSGVSAHLRNSTSPASPGSEAVTSLGFQPQLLLAMSTGLGLAAAGTTSGLSFGWATASDQYQQALRVRHVTPQNAKTYSRSGRLVSALSGSGDTVAVEVALTSLDADGYTLNHVSANNATGYSILALRGINVAASTATQRTSPGTQDITGVSFAPSHILTLACGFVPGTSIVSDVMSSLGLADGSAGIALTVTGNDGAAGYETHRDYSTSAVIKKFNPGSSPTLLSSAALQSLNSDGFSLNWGSADGTATEIAWLALGVPTISVSGPSNYQTFQRSGTAGTISIEGSISGFGAAQSIEASWNGGAYSTIDTDVTGAFSGSLAVSQGQGTLTVRVVNDTSVSVTRQYVGVGDVYLVAGQSNGSGRGTNNQSYSHATLKATLFGNDYVWKELTDPYDTNSGQLDSVSSDSGAAGSVWPLVATQLMAAESVPVAFVPACMGGTSLATQWLPIPSNHQDRTHLYGSMVYRAVQTGARMILWWQGETDGLNGRTQAQYKADLDTLVAAIQSDLGKPILIAKLQTQSGVADASEAAIRAAQADAWATTAGVKPGPDLVSLLSDDAYHLQSNTNLASAADLWYDAIDAVLHPPSAGVSWHQVIRYLYGRAPITIFPEDVIK